MIFKGEGKNGELEKCIKDRIPLYWIRSTADLSASSKSSFKNEEFIFSGTSVLPVSSWKGIAVINMYTFCTIEEEYRFIVLWHKF